MVRAVLAELDPAALLHAFDRAYEDYVVPLRFDAERLRLHVHAHDIELGQSPLFRDEDGGFVGLAMLGVRGDRGWIGGFGVAKEHRGQGLSHALCAEVIERARGLGLARLQLEVIDANPRAIATYVRAGFEPMRVLSSYRREPGATSRATVDLDLVAIEALPWSRAAQLQGWQREPASVMRMPGLAGLASGEAQAIVSVGHASVIVLALACETDDQSETLLNALAARYPERALVLMNEPEGTPVERAMARLAGAPFIRQHEMVLDLAAGPS